MKVLSDKNSAISSSMTLAITAKAKQLKQQGVDVISFGAGEPDFNTPENIRNAACERIQAGGIGYTEASGLPALKAAICNKLLKDNGLTYAPAQIVVSTGAKQSLYNTLQALCNPGDEVILPSPYWVSYYELIKMADAVPVPVLTSAENGFEPDSAAIEAAVTEKTKAIILNTPNNPTGAVYDATLLKAIGSVAEKYDLFIISDEIYEKLVYGAQHVSMASLSPSLYARTIVINGMSKAYAMTGWRMGYTASSEAIAKIMGNIQSHATSNPNTISQYASIEALTGPQDTIEVMRQAFDARRIEMVKRIQAIPDLDCVTPKGAFYVMVDISKFIGKSIDGKAIGGSMDFASALLESEKVAVIPGAAFNADAYVRLSYATGMENIIGGIERIASFCGKF